MSLNKYAKSGFQSDVFNNPDSAVPDLSHLETLPDTVIPGAEFYYNSVKYRGAFASEFDGIPTGKPVLVFESGGLEGSQYVFVAADGTPTENAAELQAAYDKAKTMSPSATNRITVIAAPGNYNFSSNLVINEEYIDLVSLDGNRNIVFNGNGSVSIFANNVFVKGLNTLSKQITVGSFLTNTVIENCKGGNFSFGSFNANLISTFINCEGGDNSFAAFDSAGGTFINCIGGNGSFGGGAGGSAFGVFTNCQGGNDSFGGGNLFGSANGSFTNCQGGDSSFGGVGGIGSGAFINCEGGWRSFVYNGTASGTFINCIGGDQSFGSSGTASGTFINCQGSISSFGSLGIASGIFINCIGDDYSFAGNEGTASGTFHNCVGSNSFGGGGGILSGKLYYCRLTSGIFPTVSSGGRTRLCIDGSDAQNNQG